MHRILAIFICCICLFCCRTSAEISCACGLDTCICFIQEGDEGMAVDAVQNALVAQGFLAASADSDFFDQNTKLAVMAFQSANELPATGTMDDDTLTLLLWGMLPDALDAAQPQTSDLPMWIPTDGGKRHHDKSDCSGMYDPRIVSQRNALAMGMTHCGRCKPSGYYQLN